ncbi:MAG TPA: SEFIR domain-containing protein [Thermoanaerobaculia bacterium]|jgi:hypothetical protein|nr:SEFIR domain-containing protein [Thermoanaerobaculia bacterium]
MDYSLQSLRDAFTDAAYKESRRGYKLYAVLLATTLDQRFVAEYMSLFYELNDITGEDVLVVGVQPGHEARIGEAPVRIIDLAGVSSMLQHPTLNKVKQEGETAERFLRFMRTQTTESYELARFLGIRTDRFPVLVFFADLEHPSEMVVWPIGDVPAAEFARNLRHLVEETKARCAWQEKKGLDRLRSTVEGLRIEKLAEDNYALPSDCRLAVKAIRKLRADLSAQEYLLRVYSGIDNLRAAFNDLRATPDLRVPLENIGQTIDDIENRGTGHVYAHERRWHGRLPAGYRDAVDALPRAWEPPLPPHEETVAKEASLRAELARIEAEHDGHRRSELARKTEELETAEARIASAPPVLEVIEHLLHIRSCPLAMSDPPRMAFDRDHMPIPRVFISYSHDSLEHERDVLALAQRLRDDGIDCWCDQFESSPSAGFPRWMRQQIELADFVLLVCTPTYRRRFDGAEEAGKGLGATYEGLLITQEVYDAGSRNDRFIPVLLRGADSQNVPLLLRGSKWYGVPEGYDTLRLRLMGSEAVIPHPLGRASSRDRI